MIPLTQCDSTDASMLRAGTDGGQKAEGSRQRAAGSRQQQQADMCSDDVAAACCNALCLGFNTYSGQHCQPFVHTCCCVQVLDLYNAAQQAANAEDHQGSKRGGRKRQLLRVAEDALANFSMHPEQVGTPVSTCRDGQKVPPTVQCCCISQRFVVEW